MSFKLKWTLGLTAFGVATAVVVYVLTGSVVWALIGLLAAGIVVNAVVHPGVAR
jgi:hypothetical protein